MFWGTFTCLMLDGCTVGLTCLWWSKWFWFMSANQSLEANQLYHDSYIPSYCTIASWKQETMTHHRDVNNYRQAIASMIEQAGRRDKYIFTYTPHGTLQFTWKRLLNNPVRVKVHQDEWADLSLSLTESVPTARLNCHSTDHPSVGFFYAEWLFLS